MVSKITVLEYFHISNTMLWNQNFLNKKGFSLMYLKVYICFLAFNIKRYKILFREKKKKYIYICLSYKLPWRIYKINQRCQRRKTLKTVLNPTKLFSPLVHILCNSVKDKNTLRCAFVLITKSWKAEDCFINTALTQIIYRVTEWCSYKTQSHNQNSLKWHKWIENIFCSTF